MTDKIGRQIDAATWALIDAHYERPDPDDDEGEAEEHASMKPSNYYTTNDMLKCIKNLRECYIFSPALCDRAAEIIEQLIKEQNLSFDRGFLEGSREKNNG